MPMPVTEQSEQALGTTSGVEDDGHSKVRQIAGTFITFGLLAATTSGMAAIPQDQQLVGHEQVTAAFAQLAQQREPAARRPLHGEHLGR